MREISKTFTYLPSVDAGEYPYQRLLPSTALIEVFALCRESKTSAIFEMKLQLRAGVRNYLRLEYRHISPAQCDEQSLFRRS